MFPSAHSHVFFLSGEFLCKAAIQSVSKTSAPLHCFLRQLLPADFDTGALLIVLLLLLMAGDCEENQSNALLTLALYLFL